MAYSVNQHWDPLTLCAVGRSYPPEFYNFITDANVRQVMERIAFETEEDLQNLVKLLESFNVKVVRPVLADDLTEYHVHGKYLPAPISPRDDMAMVGNKFFMPSTNCYSKWNSLRGKNWPAEPPTSWEQIPDFIKEELSTIFNINNLLELYERDYSTLTPIKKLVSAAGNEIIYDTKINSAMVSRIGRDLYFGTWPGEDIKTKKAAMESFFPEYRCHVIKTNGHLDGVFCPVKEGLIISSKYVSIDVLKEHFPGWEIIFVSSPSKPKTAKFNNLRKINQGKWWVPGEEKNVAFTNFVEKYIQNWLGLMEETVIDVNILMLDESNALCIKEDPVVFAAFNRNNITPHVVPFRHYKFWDNGLHCLTNDLDRPGIIKDYFPERRWV